jgi:hypothetical protein
MNFFSQKKQTAGNHSQPFATHTMKQKLFINYTNASTYEFVQFFALEHIIC